MFEDVAEMCQEPPTRTTEAFIVRRAAVHPAVTRHAYQRSKTDELDQGFQKEKEKKR